MRVLLVSQNFAPEPTGIGKYSGELADALVGAGHEVRVVCAPPYYPRWRIAEGHRAWRYHHEAPRPGLSIRRCPLWVPRRPGGLQRVLHLASFAAFSLPAVVAAALWKPAVAIVVTPALAAAPAAWLAARACGARTWMHVQDFELDAAFELGLLRGGPLRRVALGLERRLLRGFDRVSTISERMLARLHLKGVETRRCVLVPNGVDAEAIRPLETPPPMRAELGLRDDQVVCLFSGTMNRKQGLETVLDAAQRLRADPRIVFVFCGAGDWRPRLESLAAGAANVRFIDLQPAERLNDLLNIADIHVLPQAAGAADLVMPSKLGGMLASGRPVVAAASEGTEIASVVQGRGLVVAPADGEAFAGAVRELADDPPRRALLGAAARAYALHALHTAAVQARLLDELDALVGASRGRGRTGPSELGGEALRGESGHSPGRTSGS